MCDFHHGICQAWGWGEDREETQRNGESQTKKESFLDIISDKSNLDDSEKQHNQMYVLEIDQRETIARRLVRK